MAISPAMRYWLQPGAHAICRDTCYSLFFFVAEAVVRCSCAFAGRRSPETPDQREFVKNFITELIKMKNES